MSNVVKLFGEFVPVRGGLMERVWELNGWLHVNGFLVQAKMFVRGTEIEMREYIDTEMPDFTYSYHAVGFDEAKKITSKVYIAPKK